ncbi:MAG TPA: FAD-dependent oxidoreductase [Candidatus Limnocylindrales bacterium]|nr:FAD-dependent oxidoreductase [Candidatus Limnocylindrales bacterium]
MATTTHVIVGASLAGASAAAALRKEGFDGRIVLIGDESERPYERPELSKTYLRGEAKKDLHVHPADYYAEHHIELRTGRPVERIDADRREVHLGDERIAFDRLLLATGATPRRLDVPGGDLNGIVTLRTMADADRIREAASAAAHIVVVGGGWIGSEVAASLREVGRDVTLVLPWQVPLENVLGPEIGGMYRQAHEEHGVTLSTGTFAAGFEGHERVAAVQTSDGRRIPADLVVVGVGAEPRVELARQAGLAVDDGILVDERLETSVPGIFAAGDVANAIHPHYGRRLRVEHWDNAKRQGRAAAANMLGQAKAYDRIPYFYSDQYDIGMEYTGRAAPDDELIVRGDLETREFIAFWLRSGRVVAGMNVNVWDVAPAIEHLVSAGAVVDVRQLADVARPLEELTAAA